MMPFFGDIDLRALGSFDGKYLDAELLALFETSLHPFLSTLKSLIQADKCGDAVTGHELMAAAHADNMAGVSPRSETRRPC
jgi:hypothetical protein